MPDLSPWKNRAVRDLAWVIASPPLISGDVDGVTWWDEALLAAEYQDCLPALKSLDKQPWRLENYLSALTTKALGHRFEALVAFWLDLSPNYQLIDRNIQLHGEGRTLGELDIVVRDCRSDALIHLEVAVKFYMGLASLNNTNNWYGNNIKDSFGKKVARLKQHQTQLSVLYPEKIQYPIDHRCCCIKGRLFYPENTATVVPDGIALSHLQGHWGNDVEGFAAARAAQYLPISKAHWLAQLTPWDIEQLAPANQIQINSRIEPQCYVIYTEQELTRYFQFPMGYFDEVEITTG